VTRRNLAAVLLVAGLALPSVAAAQQTTTPTTAGQTTDPAAAGQTTDPAAGQTTDPAAGGQTTDPAAGGQTTDPSAAAPAATPPAATPTTAPAATPPPAATTATGTATQPAATSGNDRAAVIMLLLVTALLVLAVGLWLVARWQAWDPPWLARWRHATGEAGWRAGNAWSEFTDWMRLGR